MGINNSVGPSHAIAPTINIENIILPCNSPLESNTETNSSLSSCRGEYRHCGNGVFKCIRVEGAIFACCDHPQTCPGDGLPPGGGS